MGTGYAQTDPRWSRYPLGTGPGRAGIGAIGCKLTTFADFATWAGWPTNPLQLDQAITAHGGIWQRDPTGTYDFLPDNTLALLWPDRFRWLGTWPGLRSDLIDRFLPSPDIFTGTWIRANGVLTHFFPLIAGRAGRYTTDDSWDNVDKSIWSYGGLVVLDTFALQALHPAPPPKPVPQPPASQPKPVEPALPNPPAEMGEPHNLFDFVVTSGANPDLHPMAGGFTQSEAITMANEWVADKPAGYHLDVVLSFGLEESTGGAGPRDRVVYTATSPALGGRAGDR